MADASRASRLTRFVPRKLRALEAAVHDAWLRAMVALLAVDDGAPVRWDVRPTRVLFIRYDRVGDMVLCTGILRALATAFPRMKIDVLTTPANAPVLEHLPFVGDVIVHERRRWRDYPALIGRLAARRYDAVVDGLVIRPSVNSYTTLLMLASRAPARVGSAGRPHDRVYNVRVAPPADIHREHHVDHLARLAEPFGIRDADWRPTLVATHVERETAKAQWDAAPGDGPRILVNISAGQPCRRWPDDHFAATLSELRARRPDARIVIVSLEQDRVSATTLASLVGGVATIPRLRELFALVAESDLVVTPDTGVTHIASAFARPTFALLRRRAEYEMWTPYHTPSVNVFGPTEQSLSDLAPATVIAALDEALSLVPSGPSRLSRRRPAQLEVGASLSG
jgi:ADP-heptose:LPS heptosyltransferase